MTLTADNYAAYNTRFNLTGEAAKAAGAIVDVPLELGHWYTADEMATGSKKDPNGKTYVSSVKDGKTQVAATAGFYHVFFDRNSTPRYTKTQLDATWLAPVAVYKVTIKAAADGYTDPATGATYDQSAIATALAGQAINVTVNRKDNTSRAMFFTFVKAGANPTEPELGNVLPTGPGVDGETGHTFVIETNLGAANVIGSAGDGTIVYFSMYVDGVKGGSDVIGNVDNTDVNGDFKVTVAQ